MVEQVKIASVHFAPLKAERGRPLIRYVIPPAESAGKPNILIVRQVLEHDEGPYNGNKGREKITRLIDPMERGRDLIGEWTQSGIFMGPDASGQLAYPGAWLVRDRVPVMDLVKYDDGSVANIQKTDILNQGVFRDATAEEFQKMWDEDLAAAIDADARYGDRLIRQGIANYSSAKQNPQDTISNPMKLAARFYNVAPVYLSDLTQTNTKRCQYCQATISANSIKCPTCHEVVDYTQYLIQQRTDKDLGTRAAAARMNEEKQQKTA